MYRHPARPKPLGNVAGVMTSIWTGIGAGIGAGIVSMAGLSGPVHAGGFALIEHGASGMGNAYAGAAAISSDASTIWFNPAGMNELEGRELAIGLHVISTDTQWTDAGTTLGASLGRLPASGPDTASPGTVSPLPNLYYTAPINTRWRYGLSIGVPFGSSTEYDRNWKGRYTTVDSGINVIDINPALSYRLSDTVSLGFGVSVQQLSAELGSAVDSGGACLRLAVNPATSFTATDCVNAGLTPGVVENDGYAEITGDSVAFGFNLGALFTPSDALKIGIAYRHSTSHELEGDADFQIPQSLADIYASNTIPASQPLTSTFLTDTGATAEVDLPATLSLSTAWQASDRIQLLGDITWTGWSSFEELRIVYDNPLQPDTLSVQEWEDVFRYSAAINYAVNDRLLLRTGVAFDEEPIPNALRRTARIPGNDRTWLSLGAGYRVSNNISFDIGYAHLFLDETAIDNYDPESEGAGQEVRGLYDPSVDIISAQFNWAFN